MSAPSIALNNLRAFVIVIVLAFHSVLAYLAFLPAAALPFDSPPYQWRSFPIIDNERWFGFDLFCAWQDVYLITLMFFLSGLFVWPSLVRKGSEVFVRDRLLRLALPYALVVMFLMPLAHYPVYLVTAADPSPTDFWRHWLALPFWPNGPPWFLTVLLVLDLAAAALFTFARHWGDALARLSARPAALVLALVTASAIAYVPPALAFTPWEWLNVGPFAIQLSRPLHYAVYFFAGVGIGACGIERGLLAPDGWLVQRWAALLAAAAALFVLWLGITALTMDGGGPALGLQFLDALSFVLACGSSCLFVLAIFLRFADTRRRAFNVLKDNAYGLYLIHYVFVVWLQYMLLGLPIFAVIKATIVFGGTLLLSWGTVAALRRIPAAARVISTERRVAPKTS
jgi:surface polysaccharide O-acyltransferase-like enzyme